MGRKESNQTNKHVREINHMWYRGWWSKPARETQDGMEETDREWLPKWAKKDYTKTTLTPTDHMMQKTSASKASKWLAKTSNSNLSQCTHTYNSLFRLYTAFLLQKLKINFQPFVLTM